METKQNNEDVKILMQVLTAKEFSLLRDSYVLYKSLDNEEYKTFLLRRIDDVISMARYISITEFRFNQSDYEILGERLSNLKIAVRNINEPTTTETHISYLADNTKTPLILNSIAYLDNQRHYEIGSLLESVSNHEGKENTIKGSLKCLTGTTYHLLYAKKSDDIIIYDIDKNYEPRYGKEQMEDIRRLCEEAFKTKKDHVIQKIYDEMVYQSVNFHIPTTNIGYGLKKRKTKER